MIKKYYSLWGKGFDPRMNNNIKLLTQTIANLNMECLLVDFPYAITPIYNDLIEQNKNKLMALSAQYGFEVKERGACRF